MSESIAELVRSREAYPPFVGLKEMRNRIKTEPEWDRAFVGDAASLTDFIAWLKIAILDHHQRKLMAPGDTALVLGKSRAHLDGQIRALCVLEQRLCPLLAGGRFRKINGSKFAFQLALRIVWPDLVNQHGMAGYGCCTAAAMMGQIARTDPPGFATFATNLFLFGSANLGGLQVNPSLMEYFNVCNYYNREMGECDHVLLSSLREMPDALRRDVEYFADICLYLKKAGYTSIEDRSFHVSGPNLERYHGPRPPGFIWPVNHAGKRAIFNDMVSMMPSHSIIMCAEGEIANSLFENRPLSHSLVNGPTDSNHATVVTKVTRRSNDHVDFTLCSWGKKLGTRGRPYYRQGIYIETFLSRYGGFISFSKVTFSFPAFFAEWTYPSGDGA